MSNIVDSLTRGRDKVVVAGLTIGLLFFSSIFALIVSIWGIIGGVLLVVGIIGPLLIFGMIRFPKFGVLSYLIAAYLVMYVIGFQLNFPFGTVLDGLLLILIIGFFINQKIHPNWSIFRNYVSLIILVWIFYNVIQVANPNAESRMAWLYTIRSVAGVMASYFIFNYYIDSLKFVRLIFKVWLALSVIAALYAIKQEYFGFFDYEQNLLDNSPLLRSLLFIDGHWRKSSIFSDPVAFSYNMVVSSLLCIGMLTGPLSIKKKVILGLLIALFLNVMLYSGTRAAYTLVPMAMVLFAVLNFNAKIFAYVAVFSVFLSILIFMPTSNASLVRFQSAFRPSDDASYSVRVQNQLKIQPYIQTHPFGGGLGATGVWGVRFAPNSFLAQFPPDSGYVRVAVELGYVGLFLICALMFIVLKTGITNYFKIKDPELKSYCLAMILIVAALNVGNFPQEAIVQFPLSVFFYMFIALMNITLRLDQQKNPEHHGIVTT